MHKKTLKTYIKNARDQIKIVFVRCSKEIRRIRMGIRGDNIESINKRLLSDFKYKYQNIDYFVHLTDISKNEIENLVRPNNQRTKFITIPNYVMPHKCDDCKRNNYVISVGRFSHEKGFLRLLDVWAKVINNNKNWKLLLIGDGPEMISIKEKILKLNISKYVECPGFLDNSEVMRRMNESKIYAMPSYTEAFPFTLVEAMQNKLPAVSFDVRIGPRVLIENGKSGFLVNDGDIDAFADKLLLLMENESLLAEFSLNAHEKSKDFLELRDLDSEKYESFLNM